MFQSAPVLWLQGFATGPLTALLVFVTYVGHTKFYLAYALAIACGVSFRAGVFLIQMVLWNELLTNVLKVVFALPRPAEINSSVRLLGNGEANLSPLRSDAGGFWDLPKPDAVAYYRAARLSSFGFPSGHVSSATTFWGGSSAVFRSRTLAALACVPIALTALSRLYLGRHFLADIIGGLLVGGAVLVVFAFLYRLYRRGPALSASAVPLGRGENVVILLLIVVAVLVVAADLIVDPYTVGRLVGVNAALYALWRRGWPDDGGSAWQRLSRAALVLLAYVATTLVLNDVMQSAGVARTHVGEFVMGIVPPPVYLLGTIAIARRLNLYERPRACVSAPTVLR